MLRMQNRRKCCLTMVSDNVDHVSHAFLRLPFRMVLLENESEEILSLRTKKAGSPMFQ